MIDRYDHATEISKSEEILVSLAPFTANYDVQFELLNRATKKTFILEKSKLSASVADGYQYFQGFKIPSDLPAGEYEAYAISNNQPNVVSERYPKILKIR